MIRAATAAFDPTYESNDPATVVPAAPFTLDPAFAKTGPTSTTLASSPWSNRWPPLRSSCRRPGCWISSRLDEVNDYRVGIEQRVIAALRNHASDLTLSDLYYDRQNLSESLRAVVDDPESRWGVRINRLDIQKVGEPGGTDTTALLTMLATLQAAGILTSEEFQAKRRQVLSRLTTEVPDPDRM